MAPLDKNDVNKIVAWRLFEEKVIHLFRSAGYQVLPKAELAGFEFDLLVTAPGPFGSSVRMAVECKHHENRAVGNTEIHGFLTAFRALSPSLNISLGVIVTNTSFSRQAHEASSLDQRLKLLRIQELEEYLLGLDSYLSAAGNSYTSLKQTRGYMVLSGEHTADDGSTQIKDLSGHLQQRLLSSDEYFAFVLGDFGSGKTTIAESIHKGLTERYLTKTSDRIPFIFYLKTLAQFETEAAFVSAQIQPFSSTLRFDGIQRLANQRKIILILDGFDEVATHASEFQRLGLFSRVLNLTQISRHILITSRPSYFGNITEINHLVTTLIQRDHAVTFKLARKPRRRERDAAETFARALAKARKKYTGPEHRLFPVDATDIFFVSALSREQVIEYFSLYETEIWERQHKTPDQVYEVLSSIYDLSDLMSRPLLLTMFSEVLLEPEFNLDEIETTVGAAEIYIRYINIHLDRDWQKGPQRQFLTREERLQFARAAALAMYKNGGVLEASYETIAQIVTATVQLRTEKYLVVDRTKFVTENLPAVVNDVRVCSFLNITTADQIQFSHKSFMEFFIADIVVEQLLHHEHIDLLENDLTYEILYFIGSFCLVRMDYRVDMLYQLTHIAPRASASYKTNLRLALIYSEQVSQEQNFRDIEKQRMKIRRKEFIQCQFSEILLDRTSIVDTRFESCRFHRTLFSGDLSNVVFEEFFGRLELEGALSESKILGPATPIEDEPELGRQSRTVALDGQGDRIQLSHMRIECGGTVELFNSKITDCLMKFKSRSSILFEESNCSRCAIGDWGDGYYGSDYNFNAVSSVFRQCEFRGVWLDAEVLSTLLRMESLQNCCGLIFVDQSVTPFSQFSRRQPDGVARQSQWTFANGCALIDAKALSRARWTSSPLELAKRKPSTAQMIDFLVENLGDPLFEGDDPTN